MDASSVTRAPRGWRADRAFNFPELWWTWEKYQGGLPITPSIFLALCFEETACCNIEQGAKPIAAGPGQLQVSEDDKVQFFAGSNNRENYMAGRWDSSQTTWAVDGHGGVFKRQKPMFPELKNPLQMSDILSNKDFSVRMHAGYFQWLQNGYGRSGEPVSGVRGLLSAQTGGGKNAKAGPLFIQGGQKIDEVITNGLPWSTRKEMSKTELAEYIKKRRAEFASAIQFARVEFKGKDAKGISIGGVPMSLFGSYWEFFLPDPLMEDAQGYLLLGY